MSTATFFSIYWLFLEYFVESFFKYLLRHFRIFTETIKYLLCEYVLQLYLILTEPFLSIWWNSFQLLLIMLLNMLISDNAHSVLDSADLSASYQYLNQTNYSVFTLCQFESVTWPWQTQKSVNSSQHTSCFVSKTYLILWQTLLILLLRLRESEIQKEVLWLSSSAAVVEILDLKRRLRAALWLRCDALKTNCE